MGAFETAGDWLASRNSIGPAPTRANRHVPGSLQGGIPDDPESIRRNLYIDDKKPTKRVYYADYQQKKEVIRATPERISSKYADARTVDAMLTLAQARGWKELQLRGTQEFRAEAWVQAKVLGIKTIGYTPTATDRQEVAKRLSNAAPVVPATAPAQPTVGAAPARTATPSVQPSQAQTLAAAAASSQQAQGGPPRAARRGVASAQQPAQPTPQQASQPVVASAPPNGHTGMWNQLAQAGKAQQAAAPPQAKQQSNGQAATI
jgi:hypothetical protein